MKVVAEAGLERVSAYCDAFVAKHGRVPSRDELSASDALGGADKGWVTENYQEWLAARGERGDASADAASDGSQKSIPDVLLTVAENGRVVIPKYMRDAMQIGKDGKVTARLVDGELRLISPRAAIARIQRIARKYKKPGQSVVDEFLAERRSMWGEE